MAGNEDLSYIPVYVILAVLLFIGIIVAVVVIITYLQSKGKCGNCCRPKENQQVANVSCSYYSIYPG